MPPKKRTIKKAESVEIEENVDEVAQPTKNKRLKKNGSEEKVEEVNIITIEENVDEVAQPTKNKRAKKNGTEEKVEEENNLEVNDQNVMIKRGGNGVVQSDSEETKEPVKKKKKVTKITPEKQEKTKLISEETEKPKKKVNKREASKQVMTTLDSEEIEEPKVKKTKTNKKENEQKPDKDINEEEVEKEEKKPKKTERKTKKAKEDEVVEEIKTNKTEKKTKQTKNKEVTEKDVKKNEDTKPKKKETDKTSKKAKEKIEEKPKPEKVKKAVEKKEKPAKKEPAKNNATSVAEKKNDTKTEWEKIDFACDKKNAEGNEANLKITSWNVDGLRAWCKKEGMNIFKYCSPDILCLQETKCNEDLLPSEITELEGYEKFWCSSDKSGYAGVGLLTKHKPIEVIYGVNNEEHDEDGRCITVEFDKYYLVTVYVPNAGRKLVTLDKRLEWNEAFKNFIKELDKKKPVVICGDMNVAHNEIDLKNPKTNTKNAGFTQEERDGMTDFLEEGFVDTFRALYPDKEDSYTFWTYMMNSRKKNVGWRLDYFLVSDRIKDKVCDNVIHDKVLGSDHCPVTLFMNI